MIWAAEETRTISGCVVSVVTSRCSASGQQELDVLAPCLRQAPVEVFGQAKVDRLPSEEDAGVAPGKITDDSCRIVGRGVIADDELKVCEGLLQHGVQRLRQIAFIVVIGDEHAELRRR